VANNSANLRSRVLGGRQRQSESSSSSRSDAAELRNEAGAPDPQSQDSFANRPHLSGGDIERTEPPKDRMRRYWRQFETTPIIREPITSFARQVVEPGYRVESDVLDQDETNRLMRWLGNAAIVEGKRDRDVMKLLKKATVQREVRGTALVEKVPAKEDHDILYGVKLINPESVEVHTMPRQALLLPPEPPQRIFSDDQHINTADVPKTDSGLAAAYEQDMQVNRWRNDDEFKKYWTADQIVPLTRDADVGEVFGTSRLESCSSRIEGLKKKLQDNDEAIASKAYPLWLFMFGTDEQPWERDDIDRFMNAHDMDNFQPGLKHGVRGDVGVTTISGEVADIAEYLQFDIDYILTSMPMPKYTLGAFESQINQFVSRSQERDIQRQLKEARREIESEFSEVVSEKAQEMFDLSEEDANRVAFKMGRPQEEKSDETPNQSIIDYRGAGENDTGNSGDDNTNGDSGNLNRGQQISEQQPDGEQQDSDGEPDNEENIWTAELADPRFVSTSGERRDLTSSINNTFEKYVNTVVSRLRTEFRDAPRSAAARIQSILAQAERDALSSDLNSTAKRVMRKTVEDTLSTLESDTNLDYDATFNFTHRNNTQQFTRNVRRSTEHAVGDLGKRIEKQVESSVQNGAEMKNIIERLRGTFTRDRLRQRARLIAHMELQRAVNVTKLVEFENQDSVIGVQPINTCEENTTNVCADLVGCGNEEPAVARFDTEESLTKQWMGQANHRHLHDGFDPLPQVPPWHFGCGTEIVPVVETDDGKELTHAATESGTVFTLGNLEDKYNIEVTKDG